MWIKLTPRPAAAPRRAAPTGGRAPAALLAVWCSAGTLALLDRAAHGPRRDHRAADRTAPVAAGLPPAEPERVRYVALEPAPAPDPRPAAPAPAARPAPTTAALPPRASVPASATGVAAASGAESASPAAVASAATAVGVEAALGVESALGVAPPTAPGADGGDLGPPLLDAPGGAPGAPTPRDPPELRRPLGAVAAWPAMYAAAAAAPARLPAGVWTAGVWTAGAASARGAAGSAAATAAASAADTVVAAGPRGTATIAAEARDAAARAVALERAVAARGNGGWPLVGGGFRLPLPGWLGGGPSAERRARDARVHAENLAMLARLEARSAAAAAAAARGDGDAPGADTR